LAPAPSGAAGWLNVGYAHFSTPAAHRAGCAELSRNVIQVSDYVPSALILR